MVRFRAHLYTLVVLAILLPLSIVGAWADVLRLREGGWFGAVFYVIPIGLVVVGIVITVLLALGKGGWLVIQHLQRSEPDLEYDVSNPTEFREDKQPNKLGLTKVATLLAVGLGISVALGGVNVWLMSAFTGRNHLEDKVLIPLAFSELAGIVVCAVGLVVVGILCLGKLIFPNPSRTGDPQ